jgi:hypothetical protein
LSLCLGFHLPGDAVVLGVGTEDAAVTRTRAKHGAATGAPMEHQSGVGGDIQQLSVAAFRASEPGACNQVAHAALRMSLIHESAAMPAGKPAVGIASSATWRIAAAL